MNRIITFLALLCAVFYSFAQAPVNDSCHNATVVTLNTNVQQDTFKLSDATSDLTGCGLSDDVWYKFRMPLSGGIRLSTIRYQSTQDVNIRLYTGMCGNLTNYACTGTCQYWDASNCATELLLNDPSIAGDTVYVRLARRFNGSGDSSILRFEVVPIGDFPVNQTCALASDISGLFPLGTDTFSLLNSLAEQSGGYCGVADDVWLKFEVPSSGAFEINTNDIGGTNQIYIRLYEGSCGSLTTYECTGTCDNYSIGNCGTSLRIVNPALAGDTLWVRVAVRFSVYERRDFSVTLTEIPTSEIVAYDACENALDITAGLSGPADTLNLRNSIAETSLSGCGDAQDVWVKFEVPTNGAFELETSDLNSVNNQYFRVYEGGCTSLTPFQCTGTCNYYNVSNCGEFLFAHDPSKASDTLWVRITNRFSVYLDDSFSIDIRSVADTDITSNTDCESALDISSFTDYTDTFSNVYTTQSTSFISCGSNRDHWFKAEVGASGALEVETKSLESSFDQKFFQVMTGGCASLSAYSCVDGTCNTSFSGNCDDFLRIVDPALAGDTVWVKVADRFPSQTKGDFSIRYTEISATDTLANDDCETAELLSVSTGQCLIDTFTNINSTYSTVPTGTCGSYNGADVWFKFEMPATDDAFVSMEQVDAISSAFRITAFSGGCASLLEEACNSVGGYPDLGIRNLGLAGDTVWLHVYKTNNSEVGDTFGLCVKDTTSPILRSTVGQYEKTTGCASLGGNGWYDLVDDNGSLIASVDPTGSFLGSVCYGVSIADSAANIQTTSDTLGNEAYAAPRNFFISPAFSGSANVRLYWKERELEIWRDSLLARGESVGASLEFFYQDSLRISKVDGSDLSIGGGANPVQINPVVTKIRDSIIMAEFSVTSFSKFIPVFNPGSAAVPVPVEWLSFDAERQDEAVKLRWVTASELNCSHFEVQQSYDARNWQVIGIEEGNGTTYSSRRYSFMHTNKSYRKVYYRLKQIDYDGAYDYSNVVIIAPENTVSVSPNPFRDRLEISAGAEGIIRVQVLDMYGREVYTKEVYSTSVTVNLGNTIDHGVYTLRVITEAGVLDKKIMKE